MKRLRLKDVARYFLSPNGCSWQSVSLYWGNQEGRMVMLSWNKWLLCCCCSAGLLSVAV